MDSNRYYGGGNSSSNSHDDPGPIPDRWLDCPRISNSLIADKFLAFKTPLSARFSPKMEPKYHFPPDMVFSYIKMEKVNHIDDFVLLQIISIWNFCALH